MTLEQQIGEAVKSRRLAALNLWPCPQGWQANLTADRVAWTIGIDADPAVALRKAFAAFAPGASASTETDIFA